MAKKLFGGGKKKQAAAPAEQKGPIVKPLFEDTELQQRLRKSSMGRLVGAAFGGGSTILGDKLGG